MKNILIAPIAIALVFYLTNSTSDSVSTPSKNETRIPIPTQVANNMENEEEYEERRNHYFELIHGNNPNWKAINEANFNAAYDKRKSLQGTKTFESFANGLITAEWEERGSTNQAGNVRVTDYDPLTDQIYAISDGGILWRGDRDGSGWIPLNDGIQFSKGVVKAFHRDNGDIRILVAKGHIIWYSDDDGANWTSSTGFMTGAGSSNGIDLYRLNDTSNTLIYLYTRVNPVTGGGQNKVAYSLDDGESWTIVTSLNSYNDQFASMTCPEGSSIAYILDNNDDTYIFQGTNLTQVASNLNLSGSSSCQIEAVYTATDTTMYVLMNSNNLYVSTDGASSFTSVITLPFNTWEVGIGVGIDDPNVLYAGNMELFRSNDGGLNWNLVSDWWAYYDDPSAFIHADIMNISSYKDTNGVEFTLIPNHGGIFATYDNGITTENIGMIDLNVGQFYDVITSPQNASFIYGGTQDQGFQRTGFGSATGPIEFEQAISGDYGQMQFSGNGEHVWIQYPGADFSLWPYANSFGGASDWYNIDGANMPNYDWIVPTCAAPNPDEDYIIVGGGEIDGGSGSYLIKLFDNWGTIVAEQIPYNFRDEANSNISAIETTPFDETKWYVVTENGKFFHSEDGGYSWTKTSAFTGPSGDWIYGADIYASRLTENLVFLGGSYYAGSAVYMSVDGGENFDAINNGLPNTMVHELCMDPAEQFLFAATDAGPYVYVMAEDQWYDLLGTAAPIQEYMSVEFIEATYTVRFSTWGRGIWDFNMQTLAGTEALNTIESSVYPNPCATGYVTINVSENARMRIYDLQGHLVLESMLVSGANPINIKDLPNGTYVIGILDVNGILAREKLVVNK